MIVKFFDPENIFQDMNLQRELISGIIINGLQNPLIGDEIFLQTVKKVVSEEAPSHILIFKSLALLSILAKFFRCSDTLRPYLFHFLSEQLATGRNREIILECASSLAKLGTMGSRTKNPSKDEIDACVSLFESGSRQVSKSVYVRIYLPSQKRVAAYVDSCSLVREVVDAVMAAIGVEAPMGRVGVGSATMKLSLTESFEYRLYYRRNPKESFMLVSGASFILDLFKNTSVHEQSPRNLDLVIRRLSWLFPVRHLLSSTEKPHPFLVDMLSFQMVRSWLESNWSPITRKDSQEELMKFVSKVAALQHRASLGATEERPPSASEMSHLMPRWAFMLRPDWLQMVQQVYFDSVANLAPRTAKKQLTTLLIKECPLGAASFFLLQVCLLTLI